MLNESKTTATQKRLARDRQRKCRSRVAQEELDSAVQQRQTENWNDKRDALQVVSLFESAPGVFCKDVHEQLEMCRYMARRCIVRPVLQAGDSYQSYFSRALETWLSPRCRAAGRSIARDEIVYSVRFNYRAENITDLLAEMCIGVDPDQLIDVAALPPLKWTVLPARPVQPVDEKVQRAHEGHDQQVRDERCIASGKFSIIDDGNAFLIKPDCSETGWRFPRTFPSAQIHVHWNLLALAHQYLQNNPNDERFCPDVRARIARVYEFRLQSTKTNFARGMEVE